MAKIDLRPMTLGEILDRTFSLYKRNFWLFAGIVAIPYLLVVVFTLVYTSTFLTVIPMGGKLATPAATGRLTGATLSAVLLFLLIYLCVIAAAQAATVVAVSDLYLGRATNLLRSYARIGRRIPTVLLVMLTVALFLIAGFLLGLAGPLALTAVYVHGGGPKSLLPVFGFADALVALAFAVWVICRLAIAIPVATLEDTGVGRSISRSFRLTKGSSAQIFTVFVLTVFLGLVASLVFQLPVMLTVGSTFKPHALPIWLSVVDGLGSYISAVLVAPIETIAFALIYYNQRIRKEAFDIDQMLTALEPDSPPATPSPA